MKLLRPEDVAPKVGCHRDTLYAHLRAGRFPGTKIGSRWAIPENWAEMLFREGSGVDSEPSKSRSVASSEIPGPSEGSTLATLRDWRKLRQEGDDG